MEAPVYKEALTIYDKITGDKFAIIQIAPEMFKFKRYVNINGQIYLDRKVLSENEIKMIKRYIRNINHNSDFVEIVEHSALQIKYKPQPRNVNKRAFRRKVTFGLTAAIVAITLTISAAALVSATRPEMEVKEVKIEYAQTYQQPKQEEYIEEAEVVPLVAKQEAPTPVPISQEPDITKQHHLERFLDTYSGSSKSYESVGAITNTDSKQYKLLNNIAKRESGYLKVEDFYCVALGSQFGEIGEKYIFTLENGKKIKCIKGDEKDDIDTIEGFVHNTDSSIIEFIIDPYAPEMVAVTVVAEDGNRYVYSGNFNNNPEFSGRIIAIEKVEDYEIANSLFYGKNR